MNDELDRLQADENGFRQLSTTLKQYCGIDLPLTPKNLSLMASRLRKVLAARGLKSYRDYIQLLSSGDAIAMEEFVQALTTNTTHFFRESAHFDHMRAALPAMIAAKRASRQNELRVWCAASSTGQEPYSILMTLLEATPRDFEIKFLATDIDLIVLERAARGVYREEEIEKIPTELINKYFDSETLASGARWWRMKPSIASMIRFAPLNLIEEQWPLEKTFDIIFCRNVLIYFDVTTAQRTVERLAQQLSPTGLLYLGHSECGHVRTKVVKSLAAAVYQRTLAA